MTLPNTFIIGVQKAGTSSFYNWLSQHPDIYGPMSGKDFHFFSREDHFSKGLEHLSKRYNQYEGQKVILNAGVNYFYFPEAARRLYDFNPEAKLILILRDPVKRAFSAFNFMTQMGFEKEDFNTAIERELQGKLTRPQDQSNLSYIGHGYYFGQMQNFLKYFRRDQILVLFFEEIVQDNQKAVEEVFAFLEIDTKIKPDFKVVNETGAPISGTVNQLVYGDSFLKRLLKKIGLHNLFSDNLKYKIRHIIRERNTQKTQTKKASIGEQTYQQLSGYFEKDIVQLEELLGKDVGLIWHNSKKVPQKSVE